jgi:hypothetical protein
MTDEIPAKVAEVEPEPIGFAEFLETHPPNQEIKIKNLRQYHPKDSGGGSYGGIANPQLQLHCPSPACNGPRFFRCISVPKEFVSKALLYVYLTYKCANCQGSSRTFAIAASWDGDGNGGKAKKLGENPPFGPPLPSRLIKLIGPDRELFLKGRTCENQGLGIGAFVYYRRVVEAQKNRILSEIIKVAERVGSKTAVIDTLNRGIEETQFSKALGITKEAIPESLRINGHSPLALLHGALSEGVHVLSDDECLEMATSIRIVLAELSERVAQALKDEAELRQALSAIMNRHGSEVESSSS